MSNDRAKTPRTFLIADHIWEAYSTMAVEMGSERDALVNQALYTFARLNGFLLAADLQNLGVVPKTALTDSGRLRIAPASGPTLVADRPGPVQRRIARTGAGIGGGGARVGPGREGSIPDRPRQALRPDHQLRQGQPRARGHHARRPGLVHRGSRLVQRHLVRRAPDHPPADPRRRRVLHQLREAGLHVPVILGTVGGCAGPDEDRAGGAGRLARGQRGHRLAEQARPQRSHVPCSAALDRLRPLAGRGGAPSRVRSRRADLRRTSRPGDVAGVDGGRRRQVDGAGRPGGGCDRWLGGVVDRPGRRGRGRRGAGAALDRSRADPRPPATQDHPVRPRHRRRRYLGFSFWDSALLTDGRPRRVLRTWSPSCSSYWLSRSPCRWPRPKAASSASASGSSRSSSWGTLRAWPSASPRSRT